MDFGASSRRGVVAPQLRASCQVAAPKIGYDFSTLCDLGIGQSLSILVSIKIVVKKIVESCSSPQSRAFVDI